MSTIERRRSAGAGFTLVEVVVSLAIVAGAMVPLLTILGQASEDVLDTVRQRKMRNLMQIIMADVTLGPISPAEEGERYEEGSRGNFDGFGSNDRPDEYAAFEWMVDVFRDEIIVGGTDEEALQEAGFQTDANGRMIGRPVSNDPLPFQEEEEGPPPGQLKRVVVVSVRRLGEDADDDYEFSVMTYVPVPGEEDRQLGGGEEGGAGGAGPEGAPTGDQGGARGEAPQGEKR